MQLWLLIALVVALYIVSRKRSEMFFDTILDGIDTAVDAVENEVIDPATEVIVPIVSPPSGQPAAVVPAVVAPPPKKNRVSFWQGKNFKGKRFDWYPGTQQKLKKGVSDTLSSILVPAGLKLTVYNKTKLGGTALDFPAGSYPLLDALWNDKIRSFVITKMI